MLENQQNAQKEEFIMKKKAVVCCLVGAMALGTYTVSAANGTRNISATFRNIKIVVDGKELSTSAEPFIYNGTTYLPIRAVGEAVGKEVTWNGNTNTVYLGAVPESTQQTPVNTQQASESTQQTPAASLPLLAEYLGKGDGTEIAGLIRSEELDADELAEIYLYIMDAAPARAKAAYAEAQTAFSFATNQSGCASAKSFFETYYRDYVAPRS